MMKSARIFLALLALMSLVALGVFSFGRTTALASFVINSWQGYKLTSGLVGYWSFDGQDMDLASSTREVFDRSGNNYHGNWVNHATTTTIGKIGQGIDFDGTNDHVDIENTATLDFGDTDDFTISGWFYRDISGVTDSLVTNRATFNAADAGYAIDISASTNRVTFEVSDGTDEYSISSNTTFTSPAWNHFSIVFDQDSTANTRLYINGRVDENNTSGTLGNVGSLANAILLEIGARNGNNGSFDGKLDEIRIYNRALSAEEVKRLYLMGASTKINVSHRDELTDGLVGNWTFDGRDMDISSSTKEVYDSSGNSNHGDWREHATTTTIGKIGQAIDFDGTNDAVQIANESNFDFERTQPFSISTWIYRNTNNTEDDIVEKVDPNQQWRGYALWLDSSSCFSGGCLVFTINGTTADCSVAECVTMRTVGNANTIPLNTWKHVVATYSGNSATTGVKMYIDGVLHEIEPIYDNIITTSILNNYPVLIGDDATDNNCCEFDGKIDETRIYNRTLSAEEVKRLYLMGASTKINVSHRDELTDSSLGGYWTFDGRDMRLELSTEEIRDVSDNGLDLNWKEHATTTTVGKIGQGIWLDGTDDSIGFNLDIDSFDIGDTESFTMAGWFYRDTQTTADALMFKRQGLLAAYPGYGAYITAVSDQINFEVSDGTDEYSLDSVTTFKNPGWYHFAIVWDPNSAANTEIYINGVDDNAADTGTIANIGDLSNTRIFVIGVQSDGNSPFVGKLDDFRFYKRALSPDEIKRLYLMGE